MLENASETMRDHLLLCRECGTLLPVDRPAVPEAAPAEESALAEIDLFRTAHRDHRLEHVKRVPSSALHDRPAWDPMSTAWFRVRTDASELVVKSWRSSIDEPRRYQLVSDPLPEPECWAEVDERMLRICLDRHFYPRVLPARKLDRFVTLVREILATVDARTIETSFDDADYANAGIAPFPCHLSARLLSVSADVFDAEEQKLLASFVESNRGEDGALAVRVRRDLLAASA